MVSVQTRSSNESRNHISDVSKDLSRSVKDFLNYLKVEAGLANNTVMAYGRDLKGFLEYCNSQRVNGLHQVQPILAWTTRD